MLLRNVLFIILNFICFSVFSQSNKCIEKFKKIVYTLADDSMQGRAAGSEGEQKAKNYLLNYFNEMKLTDINIQKFTFSKDSMQIDTAYNLSGYIDNKTDSTIIIGAHYDHIGFGGPKSRSLTNKKIHPGADDNASGVAMMLSLAEYFKKSGNKKFNYLFIAFSAHEDGLYGSEAFVAEKIYDLNKVKLMLNIDMVGRLNIANPILKAIRVEKDNYLDSSLNKSVDYSFQLNISGDNINYTDAGIFIKNNVPAISFTTGTHDDYHKVSDDAEKINYEGLYLITKYIEGFLHEINKNSGEGK